MRRSSVQRSISTRWMISTRRSPRPRLIQGLDAGSVLINDSTDYRLDSMPFGGVKKSGLGREGIRFSLAEMTEPKVVCWYLPGI